MDDSPPLPDQRSPHGRSSLVLRNAPALIARSIHIRGWAWSLSMLWVVLAATAYENQFAQFVSLGHEL